MRCGQRSATPSWLTGAAALVALSITAPHAVAEPLGTEDTRLPLAPFREEVLSLPGDPARPVMLQVTLFTPAGPGPFPLALANHGATNNSAQNRGERYRFTVAAYYFLSRGYAVALPMMRGFAGSGGSMVALGCNVAALAQANGRDIRGVIEALGARPDIDRTRVVVTGQSFGGWNTLGLGTTPSPGVRGLVTFNAAIRSSDCAASAQDSSMAAGAGQLGGKTTLPTLMLWGENDSVLTGAAWRALFNNYQRTNARAALLDVGIVGVDSHQVLSDPDNLKLWVPALDAFLAKAGLPSAVTYPQYLPYPVPPATTYAAVDDVASVPLTERGKAIYRKFLASPRPRAFVIGPHGAVGQAAGGYDPLGVALQWCGRLVAGCQPYAYNDTVVWTGIGRGAADAAMLRRFSKAVRRDASTTLGSSFALNRDCTSRGLSKVLIATPPAHGTVAVGPQEAHPVFPAGHPLAACNTVGVPATAITYTPAPGFSGTDSLTIDETDIDGRRKVTRIVLTVS